MFKNPKKSAAGMAFAVLLAGIILAGCGSSVSQTPTSSLGQQSTTQQQPTGTPGQPAGAPNMDAVLKRAAEILGISADKFAAAFKNAMPTPQSGQQGQPPATPPAGQQPGGARDMTAIYAKMATELNISADAIAKAMTQAEQEFKTSK